MELKYVRNHLSNCSETRSHTHTHIDNKINESNRTVKASEKDKPSISATQQVYTIRSVRVSFVLFYVHVKKIITSNVRLLLSISIFVARTLRLVVSFKLCAWIWLARCTRDFEQHKTFHTPHGFDSFWIQSQRQYPGSSLVHRITWKTTATTSKSRASNANLPKWARHFYVFEFDGVVVAVAIVMENGNAIIWFARCIIIITKHYGTSILLLSVAYPAAYVRSTPYYMQHSPSPPFSASADIFGVRRHKSNGVHIYTKRNRVSNWFVCPQLPIGLCGWRGECGWLLTTQHPTPKYIHLGLEWREYASCEQKKIILFSAFSRLRLFSHDYDWFMNNVTPKHSMKT